MKVKNNLNKDLYIKLLVFYSLNYIKVNLGKKLIMN